MEHECRKVTCLLWTIKFLICMLEENCSVWIVSKSASGVTMAATSPYKVVNSGPLLNVLSMYYLILHEILRNQSYFPHLQTQKLRHREVKCLELDKLTHLVHTAWLSSEMSLLALHSFILR